MFITSILIAYTTESTTRYTVVFSSKPATTYVTGIKLEYFEYKTSPERNFKNSIQTIFLQSNISIWPQLNTSKPTVRAFI